MNTQYHELVIRTEYDDKDLMHVIEIFTYDEDGDEVEAEDATEATQGIATCADQGTDIWPNLLHQVEAALRSSGITYQVLTFE